MEKTAINAYASAPRTFKRQDGTYTHVANITIDFGCPIENVSRVWADSKLIFEEKVLTKDRAMKSGTRLPYSSKSKSKN